VGGVVLGVAGLDIIRRADGSKKPEAKANKRERDQYLFVILGVTKWLLELSQRKGLFINRRVATRRSERAMRP